MWAFLAVTSADRLNAGWTAACRARERGRVHARSHIERLLGAACRPHCGIVSVLDGHPATLAWLGAVYGHKVRPLGVEHFGQTGSIPDLYRHYGIDANAIIAAAQAIAPGGPIRYLGVAYAAPSPKLRVTSQTESHMDDRTANLDCVSNETALRGLYAKPMEFAVLKQLDRLDQALPEFPRPFAILRHRLDAAREGHGCQPARRRSGLCPRAR